MQEDMELDNIIDETIEQDTSDNDILQNVQDDLKYLTDRFNDEYIRQNEDLRFESGEQWDDDLYNDRTAEDRPCYVTDFTRAQVNRICNPYILNPISIDIDERRSTVSEGMEKALQFELDKTLRDFTGDDAILTGFRNAVSAGRGFVHVTSKYTDDDTANQQVIIEPIKDSTNVFIDGEAIDGSDASVGVYIQFIGELEAREQYGDECYGTSIPTIYGKVSIPQGMVPIILYYKKEKSFEEVPMDIGGEGGMLQYTRQVERSVVTCYKIVGQKVVDQTELAMPYIPLIPIYGQTDITADGEEYSGIIKQVRDSQRLVNLYTSLEAEVIGKAPSSPWIATVEQIENFEEEWRTSNTKNWGVLPYNMQTADGKPLPAPQRIDQTANTGALIQSKESAKGDMSKSTSMYDNMFGNVESGAAESGIALQSKNFQGEIATAHFTDNLNKSLKQIGKTLIYYMSLVYDYERTVVVEETNVPVVISEFQMNIEEILFTSAGGASTESKKQLAVNNLGTLAQMNPAAAPLITTYMVDYMDIQNGDKLKAQLEKLLPPELQAKDEGEQAPDPEAVAALEQANGLVEEMKATNAQLLSIIDQYQQAQLNDERDRTARLTEAEIKAQTDIAEAQIKADSSVEVAKIKANASYQERELANNYEVATKVIDNIENTVDETTIQQDLIDPQAEMDMLQDQPMEETGFVPLADGPLVTDEDITIEDL